MEKYYEPLRLVLIIFFFSLFVWALGERNSQIECIMEKGYEACKEE